MFYANTVAPSDFQISNSLQQAHPLIRCMSILPVLAYLPSVATQASWVRYENSASIMLRVAYMHESICDQNLHGCDSHSGQSLFKSPVTRILTFMMGFWSVPSPSPTLRDQILVSPLKFVFRVAAFVAETGIVHKISLSGMTKASIFDVLCHWYLLMFRLTSFLVHLIRLQTQAVGILNIVICPRAYVTRFSARADVVQQCNLISCLINLRQLDINSHMIEITQT